MSSDFVSFVVPMKNSERTIERCLDSIINQSGDYQIGIVVIDDASEDNSAEKVKNYLGNSKARILLLQNLETHGRSSARNRGLEHSKSPYVAFVDSDIELPPDWLMKRMSILKRPNVACTCCKVYPDGYFSHITELFHVPFIEKEPLGHIHGSNLLCKSESIRKIEGFDTSFQDGEDIDLSFRLQEAGFEVVYTYESTCNHRVQPSMAKLFQRVYCHGKAGTLLLFKHKTWRLQDVVFIVFLLTPLFCFLCHLLWGPTSLLLIGILSIISLAFLGSAFAFVNFEFKDMRTMFLPVAALSFLLVATYLIGRLLAVKDLLYTTSFASRKAM